MSGFVGYLRDGLTLTPANDKAKRTKKKRLEAELLRLLAENDQSDAGRLRLLAVAMAYFHGVARKDITAAVMESAVTPADKVGAIFTAKGAQYWLPSEFRNL